MLVIERKDGERIVIQLPDGREIRFTVDLRRTRRVPIGFDAPSDIRIHREENHEAMKIQHDGDGNGGVR